VAARPAVDATVKKYGQIACVLLCLSLPLLLVSRSLLDAATPASAFSDGFHCFQALFLFIEQRVRESGN
jgi:hypothetical protein